MIWVVYGVVIAACIAFVIVGQKRKSQPVETTQYDAPQFVDRNDLENVTSEVFVVAFTSATCDSCHDIWNKLQAAQTPQLNIVNVEYDDAEGKKLHKKYDIEAVPTVVICDANGTTQKAFLGSVTATDLWAGIAEVRGAEIQSCSNH